MFPWAASRALPGAVIARADAASEDAKNFRRSMEILPCESLSAVGPGIVTQIVSRVYYSSRTGFSLSGFDLLVQAKKRQAEARPTSSQHPPAPTRARDPECTRGSSEPGRR